MRIPGLPGTDQGIRNFANRKGWEYREVPGKGGRSGKLKEFFPPPGVLQAIREREGQVVDPDQGSGALLVAAQRYLEKEVAPMTTEIDPDEAGWAQMKKREVPELFDALSVAAKAELEQSGNKATPREVTRLALSAYRRACLADDPVEALRAMKPEEVAGLVAYEALVRRRAIALAGRQVRVVFATVEEDPVESTDSDADRPSEPAPDQW